MKRTIVFTLFIALGLIGLGLQSAHAQSTQNFAVTAEVPEAGSIVFNLFEIDNDVFPETPEADTNVDFGILSYDEELGIFLPQNGRYYALDLGTDLTGAGSADDINFTYEKISDPNEDAGNPRGGLGDKVTLAVARAHEEEAEEVLDRLILNNAGGASYQKTQFTGGWPRIYIGVNTGEFDSDDFANLSGGEVFTLADEPGIYSGSLTVSATVN
ncbi:MAG: hypothetical protein ACLFPX_01735 [Candidatus Omnitrophota bacterium]